jgi:hypothetical protein
MGWRTVLHVPPTDHAYFKRLARERGMTMAGFVGRAVRNYVTPVRRASPRPTSGKKQLEQIDDSPSMTIDRAPFWAGRRRG